jgi:hypothetical protein
MCAHVSVVFASKHGPIWRSADRLLCVLTAPCALRVQRIVDAVEYGFLEEVIVAMATTLAPLMAESFNATYEEDCGDNCLTWTDTAPRTWVGNERKTWFWCVRARASRLGRA